uniref:Nuclear receptor domain-containing protein n=1 Tax=Angiostrongylus cantonensis TaxID=6313 RepID=A0A0K0DMP0_ANGCA
MTTRNMSASQLEELCFVCQDISTGYHYGVPSCNGCKTFFRRTIMKNQNFVCQNAGTCPVDKSIRCACRHCRFEKCVQVGMNRNAIQQNRDPIGYTKRTRRYPRIRPLESSEECPPKSKYLESSLLTNLSFQTSNDSTEDAFLMYLTRIEQLAQYLRLSQFTSTSDLIDAVSAPCLLFDEQFMASNSQVAPQHTFTKLTYATQSDYQYWHERDWLVMIEWAKAIPTYEQMAIADKLAILRHSAITYPSLIHTFFSPDHGPDTIVFPSGAFFDRTIEPSRPVGFNRKKYQMLDQLLKPMREMRIDTTEFAAFKTIFFLNTGNVFPLFTFYIAYTDRDNADGVNESSRLILSKGRSSVTNALYRYMLRKRDAEEAGDRFGRLLLLGTVLATIAVEMKEAVLMADFFDQITFSTFAKQLLFGIKSE